MAWNEPGRGGRDPWGGRGGGGRGGPPGLDEWLRRLRNRFGNGKSGPYGVAIIIAILICAWLVSGFYRVGSSQTGLVTRFGAYAYTVDSGLHWHLPYPVGHVVKVDADTLQSVSNRAVLLTRDGDLVDVFVTAKYRITDPRAYAFNVSDPHETLRQVLRTVMRQVIGQHQMQAVLGKARNQVADRIQSLMQSTLKGYGIGINVVSAGIQDANPPKAVKAAFSEVAKAHSHSQDAISKAKAYASSVLPKAHAAAARQLQQARSYRDQVVDRAKGRTARFLKIWQVYQQHPDAVREHLYLSTLDQVLSRSSKAFVGAGNGQVHIQVNPVPGAPAKPAADNAAGATGKAGADHNKARKPAEPPPALQQQDGGSGDAGDLLRSRSREAR